MHDLVAELKKAIDVLKGSHRILKCMHKECVVKLKMCSHFDRYLIVVCVYFQSVSWV